MKTDIYFVVRINSFNQTITTTIAAAVVVVV